MASLFIADLHLDDSRPHITDLFESYLASDEVRRDITSLTLKRRDVETTIESTIHALEHTLEYIRAQDVKELDELFPSTSDMGESTAPAFSIAGLERIAQATGEMLRQSTGGLSMERSGS